MIRKAWNTNLRISLLLMVAATFGTTAWADGTHGSTFTVKNQSGGKMLVHTYNGADKECSVAHKDYYIDNGSERTAKCHGQGKHRCKFRVYAGNTDAGTKITNSETCNSTNPNSHIDIAKKGETCTITGRHNGDYNCQ